MIGFTSAPLPEKPKPPVERKVPLGFNPSQTTTQIQIAR